MTWILLLIVLVWLLSLTTKSSPIWPLSPEIRDTTMQGGATHKLKPSPSNSNPFWFRTSGLHSGLMYFDPLVIFAYWVLCTMLQLCVTQLQDSFLSSPLVWPCIIPFLIPRSHPYFLICLPIRISFLSIASHYLTCYSLPSHQRCLSVPFYSSPSFPHPCPNPPDFPYTFIIPSGLGKSFVLILYRLQTI